MEKIKVFLKKAWEINKVSIISILGFVIGCLISDEPFTVKKFVLLLCVWFYGLNIEYLAWKRFNKKIYDE